LQYTLQEVYGKEAELQAIEKSEESKCQKTTDQLDTELNTQLNDSENSDVVAFDYQSQVSVQNNLSEANGWKSGAGEILSVKLMSIEAGKESDEVLKGGEIVKMSITAVVHEDMDQPILGFLVRDKLGQDLFGENTLSFTALHPQIVAAGQQFRAEFVFKLPMLPNGDYSIMTSLADGDLYNHVQHHWLHNALIMHVASSKVRYGLVGVEFKKTEFLKI
jgi:lipopolysaccharide transport system ATP-binding protein